MINISSWWIFFGISFSLYILCFLGNDQNNSILWSYFTTEPSNAWPKKPEPLREWQLNTTHDYRAKLGYDAGESTKELVRNFTFEISSVDSYIDGRKRNLITINGKYPGPLIEAFEGDLIRVKVINKLANKATALHFHGMAMNNVNYFDGSPGLTQCGIQPNTELVYEFIASPSGTHWYHSHTMLQALEGLVGPMIIHPKVIEHDQPPSGVDRQALMLTDLYDTSPQDLMNEYQEPWVGGDMEPVPSIALVQGQKYPVLEVKTESVISIVSAASFAVFNMRLASNHSFEIKEVDGTLVHPQKVQSLLIYPGQRYSISLSSLENDWLFVTPQYGLYEPDADDDIYYSSGSSYAPLRASSDGLKVLLKFNQSQAIIAPERPTKDWQLSKNRLLEPQFEVLNSQNIPDADREIYVDLAMTRNEDGEVWSAVNGKLNFVSEEDNLLLRFLNNQTSIADLQQDRLVNSAVNSTRHQGILFINDHPVTIDLVVRNFDDGPHPIHLHGHRFWVLDYGSTKAIPPNYTQFSGLVSTKSTPYRDTVWVQEDKSVRIRVTLDSPGIWALHCHIPWHSMTGMRTAIVSLPDELRKRAPPPEWFQICENTSNFK